MGAWPGGSGRDLLGGALGLFGRGPALVVVRVVVVRVVVIGVVIALVRVVAALVLATRAARGLALLLRPDPIRLAFLEWLAVLVEVGPEVVDHLRDRAAELLLVLVGELTVVDPAHQIALLALQALDQVAQEVLDPLDLDPVEVT